jgi:ABC-2 type transport system permease protein
MYWTHVARKDFADAVRSKMFWALSVIMILLAFIGMYIPRAIEDDPDVSTGITILGSVIVFLIPIIGLIVGYMSVVGERQSGSIRMLLSLPLRRGEVFFGKFVGRSIVLAVPIVIGFALAVPFVLVIYGEVPGIEYLEFVTRALLTGIVYVAVAVGISGSVDTRGKALAGVVGIYFLFEQFWSAIPLAIYWVINRELPGLNDRPAWFEFITQIDPTVAVSETVSALFDLSISTDRALITQEWVTALLVILWITVPLGLGYLRFKQANIS